MDGGPRTPQPDRAPARGRILHVAIRPLERTDGAGVAALFHRLSAESRRRRFLTGKEHLSAHELRTLTDIDHVHHEALAAVDPRDGSFVGIARYVERRDRPGIADVAIEVGDDRQRAGIGTLLAHRLAERGRANGIAALEATMLWENRAARALARRLGFHARASRGTEIELVLTLSGAAGIRSTHPDGAPDRGPIQGIS
jgi:RimJ/RimL family protein N-acetyltransferase